MKNKWNKRPIPISLYNCYRTVRHEKGGITSPDSVSHASLSCNSCGMGLLFHLFFMICHPYIPLHLEEMIFTLVLLIFGCANTI